MKNLTTYYLLLTAVLFLVGFSASADLPPPRVIDLDTFCCGTDSSIVVIGNFMLTAGVILAVIIIVYSGIRWMTAGGDAKGTEEARKTLISGIWGVGIILGVGLIIKTVAAIVTGDFFN